MPAVLQYDIRSSQLLGVSAPPSAETRRFEQAPLKGRVWLVPAATLPTLSRQSMMPLLLAPVVDVVDGCEVVLFFRSPSAWGAGCRLGTFG